MKQRIITATVAIMVLVAVLFFKNILLRPAMIIVALCTLYEFLKAFNDKYKIMWIPIFLFSIFNYALLIFNDIDNVSSEVNLVSMMITFILFIVAILMIMIFKNDKYDLNSLMIAILGYIYSTVFFSFIYLLGTYDTVNNSLFYLLVLFAIAWGADTGGYIVGCAIGKHKLCEKLSPKKTYEGAVGGLLFSTAIALVVVFVYNTYFNLGIMDKFWTMSEPINVLKMSILFICLSVFAQIGDFIASSFKRFVGIKDYSNIMPGHGGFVDRFDSVLFVAPMLYLIIILF
ncbi:MAG: phosphatidate cytidylyltransferase [Clostridia bacterium]|nr:phosphatidate cytidylyltransferase [Clostridia bacterium]